ncbi:DUF4230 domain-containing protein [Arenibacter latericius]|uniref:DUF4230 domain-containing protein n=1 Tax=Arenibacter latericius TaxID=86104 RepID=UPI00040E40BB|nr:DUF4230 domain-containing protein [Arenibacter latericius]MDX1364444.1 DUF4230 domain-containing protein [Arenibacter latericius]
MRNIIIGIVLTLTVVLVFRSCSEDKKKTSILEENSMLIQEQVNNVAKLIVTEGHFAEVYNYKDSQQLFGPLITADKKALVVVNAEVTVAYDLSKIDFEVDKESKTLFIRSIPKAEIKIYPDFEYYDVTADFLNQFNAGDYNKIKRNVNASLMKKIDASSLKSNAENRLISELSKFLVLTNTMGWTLVYGDSTIESLEELKPTNKIIKN